MKLMKSSLLFATLVLANTSVGMAAVKIGAEFDAEIYNAPGIYPKVLVIEYTGARPIPGLCSARSDTMHLGPLFDASGNRLNNTLVLKYSNAPTGNMTLNLYESCLDSEWVQDHFLGSFTFDLSQIPTAANPLKALEPGNYTKG